MYFASAYFESQILNTFRNITAAGHRHLYIGLFQTNPGETGTSGTEIVYAGYERRLINFTSPEAAQNGDAVSISNESDLTFPNSETAAGNANFIGIFDSPTGGNMILYGDLAVPLVIGANTRPSILAGDIRYVAQGNFSAIFKEKYLNILRGHDLDGFVPHWALFSGDPQRGGTEFSEASYRRVPVIYGEVTKTVGEFSRIENTETVSFPPPHNNWGLRTHNAIMDAAVGGNLCAAEVEAQPKEIIRNYRPAKPQGWSVVTMD